MQIPVRPFEVLDTHELFGALADYTARYTKILAEGGRKEDMINWEETIQSLIKEIELRKILSAQDEPAGKKNR